MADPHDRNYVYTMAEDLAHEVEMMLATGWLLDSSHRTPEESCRLLGMRLAQIARGHMKDDHG